MYTHFRCAESPEHVAKTNNSLDSVNRMNDIREMWLPALAGVGLNFYYFKQEEKEYTPPLILIEDVEFDYLVKPVEFGISVADLHDWAHNLVEIKVRAYDRAMAMGYSCYGYHSTQMEKWRALNNACKLGAGH